MTLALYNTLSRHGAPLLHGLLAWRRWRGKEDALRLYERTGQPSLPRPDGPLIWIHAASVGEAQSALILIDKLKDRAQILITSGTVTSARLLSDRLPQTVIHQYIPLDAPQWVESFLNHWRPDLVLWAESELWPNMLGAIKARNIPAILVNARLSDRSFNRWRRIPQTAAAILDSFSLILAQTHDAMDKYKALGAGNVQYTDNIKFSAHPLPHDRDALGELAKAVGKRPLWIYASTHEGEEEMAARLHDLLKCDYPGLLTILVPRHPERRAAIRAALEQTGLNILFRGSIRRVPQDDTDLYIADTIGELGLFYRLSPIAMIGRSFSKDGGGGHNPIEAAQLDCAVLSGPHVQYQQALFNEMVSMNAAQMARDENHLYEMLYELLGNPAVIQSWQQKARAYAEHKSSVVDTVMNYVSPYLDQTMGEK